MEESHRKLLSPLFHGLLYVLGASTLPVVTLFNRSFGERYCSLARIIIALLVMPLLSDLVLPRPGDPATLLAYRTHRGALIVFAIVMLWHWLETRDRLRH